MEENQVHKLPIDVRRFVSFGTIKGFLKRLHCYPVWALHPDITRGSHPSVTPQATTTPNPTDPDRKPLEAYLDSSRARYGYPRGRPPPRSTREPAWLLVMQKLEGEESSTTTTPQLKSRRSVKNVGTAGSPEAVEVPIELPLKLDGNHHLDALCVEFGISLIQLEQILRFIDALSLEQASSTDRAFNEVSAMQTIYY